MSIVESTTFLPLNAVFEDAYKNGIVVRPKLDKCTSNGDVFVRFGGVVDTVQLDIPVSGTEMYMYVCNVKCNICYISV